MSGSVEILDSNYEPLLSPGMSCSISARNSGPGKITITYPLAGVRADQLGIEQLVRARASSGTQAVELAPYVLADYRVDLSEDDKIPMGVWEGVHHAWFRMYRSLCHNNYFPGGITPTSRLNGNAGNIMRSRILFYAKERGVLTGVSFTGDFTHDAREDEWLEETFAPDLSPWDRTASEIITQISEADPICEWDIAPQATLVDDETDPEIISWVRLYNPGSLGTDLTSVGPGDKPLTVRAGRGVTSAPKNQSAGDGPLHRVFAYNKSGDHAIVEIDGIEDIAEINEAGLSVPDAAGVDELARRANRMLVVAQNIATEQSISLDLSVPTLPVPGVDVNVGDHLFTDLDGEEPPRRRLAEWSMSLSDEGEVTGGLVLDRVLRTITHRFDRAVVEQARQINLLTSGEYE